MATGARPKVSRACGFRANPPLPSLMKMASAIRFLVNANSKFQIKDGGEVNAVGVQLASPENRIPAVNVELRQAAEFSEDEINEILRQAGYRSLVQPETAA